MTDIYDQHQKAFPRVSAYVIAKDGERVATIAFKFPVDGAGRLYAYVHWFGVTMVRGFAGGYGYDKRSAAVANAVIKMKLDDREDRHRDDEGAPVTDRAEFIDALFADSGHYWDRRLQDAGFTVWQAV